MLAVDLFAGAGGSSTGAEAAGARVVLAANHWRAAVEVHRDNHPEAEHWLQDLQQADFQNLPRHDLLLTSPSCVGHARCRGAERPGHDAARSTAWAVVSVAEAARPPWVVVENVPEFLQWVVPQNRRRLYVICSRSRRAPALSLPTMAHRPAAAVLRWGAGDWRPWGTAERRGAGLRPLCTRTLARLAVGRREHGERFLLPYYGSERGGRSVDRPCGTLTTRDRYAVVDGSRMRWLSVAEQLAISGFPSTYRMPADRRLSTHLIGNAVCPPVMEAIVRQIAAS